MCVAARCPPEFQALITLGHIVQAIQVVPGGETTEPPWLILEWIALDLSCYPIRDDDIGTMFHQVSSGLSVYTR